VDKCTSKGRSYENLQNDVVAAGRGNLIFNFRGPGDTIFPTALAANLTAEATDVATPVKAIKKWNANIGPPHQQIVCCG